MKIAAVRSNAREQSARSVRGGPCRGLATIMQLSAPARFWFCIRGAKERLPALNHPRIYHFIESLWHFCRFICALPAYDKSELNNNVPEPKI